ncbi:MAG: hypothetical protein K6T80_08045 [Firmicutes bacterium]|nr:hypothetical protein [Bacillota bacterium]
MKKEALLISVNCRQLQDGLASLQKRPVAVFGVRDTAALCRASGLIPEGVRVYFYESG